MNYIFLIYILISILYCGYCYNDVADEVNSGNFPEFDDMSNNTVFLIVISECIILSLAWPYIAIMTFYHYLFGGKEYDDDDDDDDDILPPGIAMGT